MPEPEPEPARVPIPPLKYNTRTQEPIPQVKAPIPPVKYSMKSGGGAERANPNAPITFVPEERPMFKGENPNYAASTPREELGPAAMRRKPGAARQMQQLGQPIIYIPGEADVPPPRR